MFVRDINGKPLFVMDGDVGRDTSGKPIVSRGGSDGDTRRLAACAATWMSEGDERTERYRAGYKAGLARATATVKSDEDRKVLMDLAQADVVTASTQSEFAIPPGDFIADIASQVRPVSHDRGYWYLENVTDAVKLVEPEASVDAAPPEITPGYAKTLFTTVGYALAAKLPREVSGNADWDLKLDAVKFLTNALRLAREVRVANLLTTTGNWPSSNQVTVAAGNKWNFGTGAAPLNNLFSALADSYLPANLIVISENVAPFYYGNPATNTATITVMRDYVQSGGEMPKALFGRAKYFSGGSLVYVWGPSLPTNVPVIRSPDSIPTSVTFRWLGEGGPDGERRDGMLVREYYDPRDRSDYVVVAHNDIEVFVSNQVGALIVGALQ